MKEIRKIHFGCLALCASITEEIIEGSQFPKSFDVDYIRSSAGFRAVYPGEPFTVIGFVSVEF